MIGIQLRAGSGVIYGNTFKDLRNAVQFFLMFDWCKDSEWNHPHHYYIWDNNLINTPDIIRTNNDEFFKENYHYFLRAPNLVDDGFEYTPYPYPHPLVSGEVVLPYSTPWSGELEQGIYRITMPEQVKVGDDVYVFKQWEDGSTSNVREVNLTSNLSITAMYELTPPTPPPIRITGPLGLWNFPVLNWIREFINDIREILRAGA